MPWLTQRRKLSKKGQRRHAHRDTGRHPSRSQSLSNAAIITLFGHCTILKAQPTWRQGHFQRHLPKGVGCSVRAVLQAKNCIRTIARMSADDNTERTFLMIKPDAVHRGLIADIIKRFEQKGFKLVAMKFVKV